MRTITQHAWDYRGLETDEMTALVGVGVTRLDAMGQALSAARRQGWNLYGVRISNADLQHVCQVQGEHQEEQFLATLFLSDQEVAVSA